MSIACRVFILIASLLLATGPAPSAWAAPDDAETLLKRGVELRRSGKDAEALSAFQKAYESSHSPRALAQIGLAEQALGLWVEADTHLREAMQAKTDPWIQKNRTILQSSLDVIAKHLGTLEVLGGPRGAEVLINGQLAGTLPLEKPARVPTGEAAVEVRAPGHLTISRRTQIAAQELHRETIVLQPVAAAPAPAPSPRPEPSPAPAPAPAGAGPVTAPTITEKPAPAPERPWRRTAAWVSVGSAGLFAATGAAGLVFRELKARDYNDDGCAATPTTPSCRDTYDAGLLGRDLAIGAFIAAGVAAAAATYFFLTAPEPAPARSKTLSFTCAPDVTAPGAACVGRF